MKKAVAVLLTLTIICGLLCSCQTTNKVHEDYDIMVAQHIDYGAHFLDEDYWTSTVFTLNTNGILTCVEHYNLSEDKITTVQLQDNLTNEIVTILNGLYLISDDDSSCDGSIWDIKYYNSNNEEIADYHGYIYHYNNLMRLSEILYDTQKENR